METTGVVNFHNDVIGFLGANRDRIAGILFVGDQQGSAASDGAAGGTDQTPGMVADRTYFEEHILQPILDLQIPVALAKGNHDKLNDFDDVVDATLIAALNAMPTVEHAEASGLYGDHMAVVVNNFLGGQLVLFGMADDEWRDDYVGCAPGPFPCETGVGNDLGFWNQVSDLAWTNGILTSYPTAHAAMVVHNESTTLSYVDTDSQFVLFAAGHVTEADYSRVDNTTHPVVYVNHNTQWYTGQGDREITVVRFDPVNGKAYAEQVDTRGWSVRDIGDLTNVVGPTYKSVSEDLTYAHIGAAGQVSIAPTYLNPTPPTSGGWLDDNACQYAFFLGNISNANGCQVAPPAVYMGWADNPTGGHDFKNGFVTKTWDGIVGSLADSIYPGAIQIQTGGTVATSTNVLVKDTTVSGTWSPGILALDDIMLCYWVESIYNSGAEHEAAFDAGDVDNESHIIEWSNEIEAFVTVNSTPRVWRYQFGSAYITVDDYFHDGDWHHECVAWGRSAYAAGGTGGAVLLWRDGALVTATTRNDDTTALVDPVADYKVLPGENDGWHGWVYEHVFLDISLSGSTSQANLTAIANYIRLCGVADNAISGQRAAAYGGTATVLGPLGGGACTN